MPKPIHYKYNSSHFTQKYEKNTRTNTILCIYTTIPMPIWHTQSTCLCHSWWLCHWALSARKVFKQFQFHVGTVSVYIKCIIINISKYIAVYCWNQLHMKDNDNMWQFLTKFDLSHNVRKYLSIYQYLTTFDKNWHYSNKNAKLSISARL